MPIGSASFLFLAATLILAYVLSCTAMTCVTMIIVKNKAQRNYLIKIAFLNPVIFLTAMLYARIKLRRWRNGYFELGEKNRLTETRFALAEEIIYGAIPRPIAKLLVSDFSLAFMFSAYSVIKRILGDPEKVFARS